MARSGVKIEGVPYLDYENAKKWIESDQVSQIFSDRLVEILKSSFDQRDTSEIFEPAIENIKRILELSLSSAIRTEILPDKLKM